MGKILFALLVLTIVAIAAAVAVAVRSGMSARGAPTASEAMIARGVRHERHGIAHGARRERNCQLTPNVQKGREHFADHCAICHANDGSGKTNMGPNFYPRVPDMRDSRTQQLMDGEMFYIIKNGVRFTGMPAWGDEHDQEENWHLVHFIRHLPKIAPAELEEMKRLNPVSSHEREEEQFLEGSEKHEHH